jgi:hypothetical protein
MCKVTDQSQPTFLNFNQPLDQLEMNPENRWIKMANQIPWERFEEKYAALFPSDTGNVAKPLRMALGALIIQTKYGFSDKELVEQLTENPYYQYFIGLIGYQKTAPFEASTLVSFRKRISADMLMEVKECLLENANKEKYDDDDSKPDSSGPSDNASNPEKNTKKGTLILDATCAPSNIRYPQDYSLLNEGREKLEKIIDRFCSDYSLSTPRMYRKEARKNYLSLAKAKRPSKNKIRKIIRKQLGYVKRDLGYLSNFMVKGYAPIEKEIKLIETITTLYEQQNYVYEEKTHLVKNRIVSINQPYLRPIVRGKAKNPVEFGAKFDLSIDEHGYGRIEKLSFEAYNESTVLQDSIERYKERIGHYPKRVLVDQIYRTRNNRSYCKLKDIRLPGPKLGRPSKDNDYDKKIEYQDNVDRIEVERSFSLSKRCYNLGLIKTKLKETTMTSIALSIFVTNLFKILLRSFVCFVCNLLYCRKYSLVVAVR